MKTCKICDGELTGRQRLFCSHSCQNKIWAVCVKCKERYARSRGNTSKYCKKCFNTGERNHAWRGGHAYWQPGKLGIDPQGLSWKRQRRLAWERDNYTCQEPGCGKTREELGQKPDVDHIKPYRVSFSHALDNLICRCRSCHKKAEAKKPELWGGKIFGGHLGRKKIEKEGCCECGSKRRKLTRYGNCLRCERTLHDIPKAKEMRKEGYTLQEIADYFETTNQNVSAWLLGKTFFDELD